LCVEKYRLKDEDEEDEDEIKGLI
ncbi:hypothetical protein Tco_1141404, partial [Tanacetum coccineum]